ncbi:MAG: hypothetical protein IJ696_03725 [Ruminococcus sp.]|nr:hypothetical protein [Ruminococcus sp.]
MRPLFISMEAWAAAGGILTPIIKDICHRIDEDNFDLSPYSAGITSVGIIINCFDDSLLAAGWGKPRRLIRYNEQRADIRLPMPYNELIEADRHTRYLMTVKNITESIAVIGERCRKSKRARFDSEGMTAFILERLDITPKELVNIHGIMSDEEYNAFMKNT